MITITQARNIMGETVAMHDSNNKRKFENSEAQFTQMKREIQALTFVLMGFSIDLDKAYTQLLNRFTQNLDNIGTEHHGKTARQGTDPKALARQSAS